MAVPTNLFQIDEINIFVTIISYQIKSDLFLSFGLIRVRNKNSFLRIVLVHKNTESKIMLATKKKKILLLFLLH